jgi:hypothetical protein
MQMRFFVDVRQTIEHRLQVFYSVVIVSNNHKAKAVIALLIAVLSSSVNELT